jgi:Phage related hypothetical protein (DUF1799)
VVRALLAGPPKRTAADEQTLAFLGITADQLKREPEQIDVWPEHHIPLRLFNACITQWRAAPAGLIGLDYSVIPWLADMAGISPAELREAWPALQDMEAQALALMAQMRGRADG